MGGWKWNTCSQSCTFKVLFPKRANAWKAPAAYCSAAQSLTDLALGAFFILEFTQGYLVLLTLPFHFNFLNFLLFSNLTLCSVRLEFLFNQSALFDLSLVHSSTIGCLFWDAIVYWLNIVQLITMTLGNKWVFALLIFSYSHFSSSKLQISFCIFEKTNFSLMNFLNFPWLN